MNARLAHTLSMIVGALLACASVLLIIGYATDAPRVDFIFVLGDNFFAAAAVLVCIWALMRRNLALNSEAGEVNAPTPRESAWFYALIAVVHVGGVLLRLIAPGMSVLTWIVAPIWIFVAPGWCWARWLMPGAGWAAQFAFAPPLSISLQVIGVMWLAWLNVPITIPILIALNGVLTLSGLLIAIVKPHPLPKGGRMR